MYLVGVAVIFLAFAAKAAEKCTEDREKTANEPKIQSEQKGYFEALFERYGKIRTGVNGGGGYENIDQGNMLQTVAIRDGRFFVIHPACRLLKQRNRGTAGRL